MPLFDQRADQKIQAKKIKEQQLKLSKSDVKAELESQLDLKLRLLKYSKKSIALGKAQVKLSRLLLKKELYTYQRD